MCCGFVSPCALDDAKNPTVNLRLSVNTVSTIYKRSRRRDRHNTKTITRKHREDRTVLIVNPNSCSGLTGKNWDQLYERIKQTLGKSSIQVAFSKKPGNGTSLARNYLKRGFTEVYAIGGDGTINEVANGFFENNAVVNGVSGMPQLKPINTDAKLAIVPCGTRNVLVKSLDLPQGVVESCKSIATTGRPVKLDVIGVQATDKERNSMTPMRIMLNAAEMGVGAEIIDRSKKVRKVVNSRLVSTITAIISTVPSYESNLCTISLDNNRRKTFDTKMTMAVVANGKFLGGGFMAAPHASVKDGLLDVVILKDSGSLKMLDELVNLKSGDHFDDDNVMYAQAKSVSIKSKERDVTVTLDGEPIGILPARFKVFHNALTVIL
jgi:YegS/Rv2252/BmrU family lipid kinase